jgi:hypothetical protein
MHGDSGRATWSGDATRARPAVAIVALSAALWAGLAFDSAAHAGVAEPRPPSQADAPAVPELKPGVEPQASDVPSNSAAGEQPKASAGSGATVDQPKVPAADADDPARARLLDAETAARLRELLARPVSAFEAGNPADGLEPRAIGWSGWSRRGGVLDVSPDLHLSGSRSEFFVTGSGAGAGSTLGGAGEGSGDGAGERAGRMQAQLLDLSATWDAVRVGGVALSLSGGVRVVTTGSVEDDEPGPTHVVPVLGPGVSWRQSHWTEARAMVLGDPGGSRGDYLELRVEQVLRLSANASLSLGYQKVSNLFGSDVGRGTGRGAGREAVLVELRVGF